ncbi:tRNA epoxyqueuosine(34) reductase QueG [Roseiconus nitratireducens]|uniref:tRNA epoxyqueuosine(34) reductase QueG n=1 Tax=Roseiconus nitratireducens TaxID=2605748 RepID=UPI001F236110|nr:tRNA epoxyqueuosine(34) reductase QueG [Roseiconus nitratireducens]
MSDPSVPNEVPSWLQPLRDLAHQLGFVRIGVAPAVDSQGYSDLVRWIDQGYAADMDYFENRLPAYRHPDGVMPGTKSIMVLAFPYPTELAGDLLVGHGQVARYAWPGDDYHDTIHGKLKKLRRLVLDAAPETRVRGCVDTAPLMERELAMLAGIGWRGKNTLLLNREIGSYFFLACLLLDVDLPCDAPHDSTHCGTCTACLDACPTDAFPRPGVLDASRCISYLTIEHRGPIDPELRSGMGEWVFGCDVCQEVCPWNRKPARRAMSPGSMTSPRSMHPLRQLDLRQFFEMDDQDFRDRFRKTPLWRTRRRGMMRNAAIVFGNQRDASALPLLRKASADPDPVVAEACRWAIDQITSGGSESTLPSRRTDATGQDG